MTDKKILSFAYTCCAFLKISEEQYRSIIEALVKVVESETAPLASAAMEALGHIGLRTTLPVITRDSITGRKLLCFSFAENPLSFISCIGVDELAFDTKLHTVRS